MAYVLEGPGWTMQCSASRLHAGISTEEYNVFFGTSSVAQTGWLTANDILLIFQDDKC